jgi:hypothetical protein
MWTLPIPARPKARSDGRPNPQPNENGFVPTAAGIGLTSKVLKALQVRESVAGRTRHFSAHDDSFWNRYGTLRDRGSPSRQK